MVARSNHPSSLVSSWLHHLLSGLELLGLLQRVASKDSIQHVLGDSRHWLLAGHDVGQVGLALVEEGYLAGDIVEVGCPWSLYARLRMHPRFHRVVVGLQRIVVGAGGNLAANGGVVAMPHE